MAGWRKEFVHRFAQMNTDFGAISMPRSELDPEEYDLAQLPILPRGRYAPGRRLGSNVVLLAPDVALAFPSDEVVNEALCLVLQITKKEREVEWRILDFFVILRATMGIVNRHEKGSNHWQQKMRITKR
jgi:hypothetical protein